MSQARDQTFVPLESATPAVLLALALAFAGVTAVVHLDAGRTPVPSELSPRALEGRRIWLEHGCATCHQLYGLGGFLGPDLTNAISRRGAQHVRSVLRDGFGAMPRQELGGDDIEALVEFLRTFDATGRFSSTGSSPSGLPN